MPIEPVINPYTLPVPTPEDMARDLEGDLLWLTGWQHQCVLPNSFAIATSACRRAIAAERERDSLKAELADGEVAGEDYCRVIRALEAEKAEAVQLLRHCRTSIEYFGGGRGFETIEALDTFLAKHAAKRNEPSPFGVGSKVPGVAQSPDGGSVAAPRPGV